MCNLFFLPPPFSQPYLPVRYHPNKEDQIHSLQPRSCEIGSCHGSHSHPHPFPHRKVGFPTSYSTEIGVQIRIPLNIPLPIPSQRGQCSRWLVSLKTAVPTHSNTTHWQTYIILSQELSTAFSAAIFFSWCSFCFMFGPSSFPSQSSIWSIFTYRIYMITPIAQQSTGRPYRWRPTTSGAERTIVEDQDCPQDRHMFLWTHYTLQWNFQ